VTRLTDFLDDVVIGRIFEFAPTHGIGNPARSATITFIVKYEYVMLQLRGI